MYTFKQFLNENWFDRNDNTQLSRRKSFDDQLGKPKSNKENEHKTSIRIYEGRSFSCR